MKNLTCRLELKGFDPSGKGEFTGHAAVYDNVDLGGDIIREGAFTRTLKALDYEVPLLWSHDPMSPIGQAKLEEVSKGLKVMGKLHLEVPQAAFAYKLMVPLPGFSKPAIKGLSFGYDTVKFEWEGQNRVLKEVKLFEVSPVVFPMNPKAQISDVKADGEGGAGGGNGGSEGGGMIVQSLIFSKEKFKKAEDCTAWAADHDYRADKVDETEDSFRLRQRDPADFDPESFRTMSITDGVSAVMGKLKSKSISFLNREVVSLQSEIATLKSTLAANQLFNDPELLHSLKEMAAATRPGTGKDDSRTDGEDPDLVALHSFQSLSRDMSQFVQELKQKK